MKLGKDLRLGYADTQGRFVQFAWAQSCSYDKTTTFVKVSSPNTGGWEHVRPKTKGWVMQHEGLLGNPELVYEYDGQQYNFLDLISHFQDNNIAFEVRWLDVSTDGTVGELKRGTAYVKSHKEVASEKALAKVSIALQGTGPLEDLSANNLKGSFAYSISDTTLSLYALQRPVAGFNITIQNGDVISDTGQTWDPVGDTLQTFTIQGLQPTSVVGGVKGDIVQHNLTFADSTTLHVVLLQTDTRDEQQQLVRTVQALWWGGYSMGNMVVTKDGASATLQTAGMQSNGEALTPFPFDILTGDITLSLTGTGQTVHSIDRTATLERTVRVLQQQDNIRGGYALTVTINTAFGTTFSVWANSESGTELASTTFQPGETRKVLHIAEQIVSEQQIHFRLEGAPADNGAAYRIATVFNSSEARTDIYYAYNATTDTLQLYSTNQVWPVELVNGQGNTIYVGTALREVVTVTATDIDGMQAAYGDYRLIDVSNVQMLQSGRDFYLSGYCFATVSLRKDGVEEDSFSFDPESPSLSYTSNVAGINGAALPSGAVQTLTYSGEITNTRITVSTKAQQTGTNTWEVRALLSSSATGAFIRDLPATVTVRVAGTDVVIPANSPASPAVIVTTSTSPAWQTPTAFVDEEYAFASDIVLTVVPTIDTTASHWQAIQRAQSATTKYFDVRYTEGRMVRRLMLSERAATTENYIASDRNMAVRLATVSVGGSSTAPDIALHWGETDSVFIVNPSVVSETLNLFYIASGNVYLCNCNPAGDHSSPAPTINTPQLTALSDIAHAVVTRPWRNYSGTVYPAVAMNYFNSSNSPDTVVMQNTGVIYDASKETDMWVALLDVDGNHLDGSWFENFITVWNCQGQRIPWHTT